MTELEKIVENSHGTTRQALEQLVHSLADSIKEINLLKQKIDYIQQDNRLLRKRLQKLGAASRA